MTVYLESLLLKPLPLLIEIFKFFAFIKIIIFLLFSIILVYLFFLFYFPLVLYKIFMFPFRLFFLKMLMDFCWVVMLRLWKELALSLIIIFKLLRV